MLPDVSTSKVRRTISESPARILGGNSSVSLRISGMAGSGVATIDSGTSGVGVFSGARVAAGAAWVSIVTLGAFAAEDPPQEGNNRIKINPKTIRGEKTFRLTEQPQG